MQMSESENEVTAVGRLGGIVLFVMKRALRDEIKTRRVEGGFMRLRVYFNFRWDRGQICPHGSQLMLVKMSAQSRDQSFQLGQMNFFVPFHFNGRIKRKVSFRYCKSSSINAGTFVVSWWSLSVSSWACPWMLYDPVNDPSNFVADLKNLPHRPLRCLIFLWNPRRNCCDSPSV